MSNKFKYPPVQPNKPFIYVPVEPAEFIPPAMKQLGQYSDGLTLADIELPDGVGLFDLYISGSYNDDDGSEVIVSYQPSGKLPNPNYAKQVKRREKCIKEREDKMAVYEAQLAEYVKAKKKYDAFWAKQK